jgi:galactose-1-phosphate uridylyltransferase
MTQQIDRKTLEPLIQARDISDLLLRDLVEMFREEDLIKNIPESMYRIDPRNGDRILYHVSRSARPHESKASTTRLIVQEDTCVICEGKTTGVVDIVELTEGFTFINKNLYPILYPFKNLQSEDKHSAFGLHFLHVIIIKNYGNRVGASLSHGHQQITFSDVKPRHFQDHMRFELEHGEPFSAYLLREIPLELKVKDYGAATLLVPPFMRRPYDMILALKDTSKKYLHELTDEELRAVAEGWHDATRCIHRVMREMDKEIAFNVTTINGPGAGLYFEFLPYTQPMGGFEHLGLYVCQETPERAADRLRRLFVKNN